MRRTFLIRVGLAVFILAGAVVTVRHVQSRLSPARFLGWKPEPAEALAESPPAASPLSPQDPLLGFSRYLPEEVGHYGAALQSGRVFRALVGSNAIRRLGENPAVKTFLAEVAKEFDLGKLPPEGRQALDLLSAAFDSEIAVALPEETPSGALNILKAIVLSAAVLAPAPYPPGSGPGLALSEKRKPLRAAWESSIRGLKMPSLVLAARVKDEKRFNDELLSLTGLVGPPGTRPPIAW